MINAAAAIGSHNLVFITFDTLRYDVAERAMQENRTPFLASLLPEGQWEKRQTPATFTYAAHHAFFAGYLPTPVPKPLDYQRLFACSFEGSATTGQSTWVTQHSNIIEGLAAVGYHTLCIGGVGFFNQQNALGRVLPDLFMESHWSRELGVTDAHSTQHQVALACQRLKALPVDQRYMLFINLSAMHQPNCIFSPPDTGGKRPQGDSPQTQLDALAYVDTQLAPLFYTVRTRGDSLCILSSDHGTSYGDDGVWGHGVAHPSVWEVPYREFILKAGAS
ncbi:STM4013/SEN3800 family hydrolase [Leucothrix pacifica]|uniref:Metalloenzyme domain-containing protein n=1 Tax=Leucothrix pacifica TaxID=1247513 RepID=A0A317CH03_9GAMM|nr:STM4013/SEN3800 family hydrolase [Leucothrix pacifica]PWQ97667.1 metalloenzyme domain-containing protein [Leucothrix pacifica]